MAMTINGRTARHCSARHPTWLRPENEPGKWVMNRWYTSLIHDDVIKWKHFPRYWPFVRGIHRSPVNFPHKGQWRGALMFSLICARINSWVNNREAGDLRRYRHHYDIIVMLPLNWQFVSSVCVGRYVRPARLMILIEGRFSVYARNT